MKLRALISVVILAAACGTLGGEGEGDRDLPSAGVGPFRALARDEVKGLAPFVLEDPAAGYREPAVLRVGTSTRLYAVATVEEGSRTAIVTTSAADERTFFGTRAHFGARPRVVLEADAAWEGPALGGPAAVRVGGEVFLYYAGAEGIGVARSADGLVFVKEGGPVLRRDERAATWESGPPRAPSVVALPGGELRMFYAAGGAIGEASSLDGLAWRRLGAAPVLGPRGSGFDAALVSDPCASIRPAIDGPAIVRVLYTGVDASGASAIGVAARRGEAPLERQPEPTYRAGRREAAPALLELAGRSFLYFQQELREGSQPAYLGIGAAVSPGTETLPPAGDYPSAP